MTGNMPQKSADHTGRCQYARMTNHIETLYRPHCKVWPVDCGSLLITVSCMQHLQDYVGATATMRKTKACHRPKLKTKLIWENEKMRTIYKTKLNWENETYRKRQALVTGQCNIHHNLLKLRLWRVKAIAKSETTSFA